MQTSPLEFICSSVHGSQGNAAGGRGPCDSSTGGRGGKLTGWLTLLGLQLSRQEDSCEAAADMLGETEIHGSICPVKIDSNFGIWFKITTKREPLRADRYVLNDKKEEVYSTRIRYRAKEDDIYGKKWSL